MSRQLREIALSASIGIHARDKHAGDFPECGDAMCEEARAVLAIADTPCPVFAAPTPHHYEIACSACGQPGQVMVSVVEGQSVGGSAAALQPAHRAGHRLHRDSTGEDSTLATGYSAEWDPWLADILRCGEASLARWEDVHRHDDGSLRFTGHDGSFYEGIRSTVRRLRDYHYQRSKDAAKP